MMLLGVIQMGALLFLLSLFISSRMLFEAFFMPAPRVYAGLVFFMMLYAPIDLFVSLLVQMASRRNEFEADRFAVATTRNPSSMAGALRKLSTSNLSNLNPHPLYVFLHDSHPPVLERIRAMEQAHVTPKVLNS
jgi:STE24 endopeptidase